MEILSFNVSWMVWNSILAMFPIGVAYVYFRVKEPFYKVPLAILWFLFFPNTLYIISDMEHITYQWWMVSPVERIILFIQYVHLEVIGLTTYIMGMYAFERELRRIYKKHHPKLVPTFIITLNFLIGFAIVLGKVERINSWDVFTAMSEVIASSLAILSSNQLVGLIILFGLFGNFFYFLFRDPLIKYFRKFAKQNS